VWVFATVFLIANLITNEQWIAISLGYVGMQGFADLAVKWKSSGRANADVDRDQGLF
jgi:hypothetical protein